MEIHVCVNTVTGKITRVERIDLFKLVPVVVLKLATHFQLSRKLSSATLGDRKCLPR